MIVRSVFCRALRAGLVVTSLSIAQWAFDARAEEPEAAALPVKQRRALQRRRRLLRASGRHRRRCQGRAEVQRRRRERPVEEHGAARLRRRKISTVTYGSKEPITKTLKTFAIDLTNNPTLAKLLDQVRGEKVEIEAPNRVTGTILGVETREQQVGDKDRVVKIELLNLLTSDGLRSFPMAASAASSWPTKSSTGSSGRRWPCWPWDTTPRRKRSPQFRATANGPCASATSSSRPSGRPATGWCFPIRAAILARLGDCREYDRRRLGRRLADAGQRPADFVHHESVSAALRAAARGRAGTVRSLRPQVYGQDMDARFKDKVVDSTRRMNVTRGVQERRLGLGGKQARHGQQQ